MLAFFQETNWLGAWTLYHKEVRRFIKVYHQTILAPLVNVLLLLAVFNLAIGRHVVNMGEVSFASFLISGLLMMIVVQNAFANTSSSLIMGKIQGYLFHYFVAPLSSLEITLALSLAGLTRGLVVGILTAFVICFFIPIHVHHFGYMLFHLLAASLLLATLGVLGGIIADTVDQISALNAYLITPLSFLSGTFYSVKSLPPFWYNISQYNPFFYMIDGFRYGLTGYHDGDLFVGVVVLLIANILVLASAYYLLEKGYRIKS